LELEVYLFQQKYWTESVPQIVKTFVLGVMIIFDSLLNLAIFTYFGIGGVINKRWLKPKA